MAVVIVPAWLAVFRQVPYCIRIAHFLPWNSGGYRSLTGMTCVRAARLIVFAAIAANFFLQTAHSLIKCTKHGLSLRNNVMKQRNTKSGSIGLPRYRLAFHFESKVIGHWRH